MMSCTGSVRGGFWGFEKSQLVEFLGPDGRVQQLISSHRVAFIGGREVVTSPMLKHFP